VVNPETFGMKDQPKVFFMTHEWGWAPKSTGGISADDYHLLRFSTVARSALVEASLCVALSIPPPLPIGPTEPRQFTGCPIDSHSSKLLSQRKEHPNA